MDEEKYAVCEDCFQEMKPGLGCTTDQIAFDSGLQLYRIPYGAEERFGNFDDSKPCHDCNVTPGQYHHSSCDWEECPLCGFQLLSCGCFK